MRLFFVFFGFESSVLSQQKFCWLILVSLSFRWYIVASGMHRCNVSASEAHKLSRRPFHIERLCTGGPKRDKKKFFFRKIAN